METLGDESNDGVIMETAWNINKSDTFANDSSGSKVLKTIESACVQRSLRTEDTVEMNTVGSTCAMDTVESTLAMDTAGSACAMDTVGSTCAMDTIGSTCKMDTIGSTCGMDTIGSTCGMDTIGSTCKMDTIGSACKMDTIESTCKMDTIGSTCGMESLKTDNILEMSSLKSKCGKNTLETGDKSDGTVEVNNVASTCEMRILHTVDSACEMNMMSTVSELKTLKTAADESKESLGVNSVESSEMKTLKRVVDETDASLDRHSTTSQSMVAEFECSQKNTEDASTDDEPRRKKIRLEVSELENASSVTPESGDGVVDSFERKDVENVGTDDELRRKKMSQVNELEASSVTSPSINNVVDSSEKKDIICDSNPGVVGEHEAIEKCCGTEVQLDSTRGSAEKPAPLTEIEAGITEYLGSHKGFSAIIKQRYSDFIVNEVDTQGNVVHLTQMNLDLDEQPEMESNQDKKITSDIISSEDLAKLADLVKNEDKKASVNICAPSDKESRTKIHLAVKKAYTQLETKTADVDGQKVIQVVWKSGKSRGSNRDDWPESKKDFKYVKFVLYKENKDTMDAIGLIASNLKLKENLFQYAGTKDKRAKTSQEITAHRIHPKKLAFMNKVLRNIGLGNFQYVKEPLKLGQLSGNQFTIVLRNVLASSEAVDGAISSLKSLGFVNYFGMQRFGTTSVPTHKVGCALLHGDWDKAVDLILMPRNDNPSKDAFQKVWMETRDPVATLKVTPPYCGLERNLLEALKRKMKALNALEKISRNTRLLYIHSYQALVWNKMVSRRLKDFGLKPVVGDLAIKGHSENSEKTTPVVVTQDNLSQFCLHDVVLPLPGYDVVYPKNEVHSWYRDTLAQDGLDLDNMRRPQKDYSLPGAYRHMTVCPSSVSWSHHRYDDHSLPLTLSDMDAMKEVTLPTSHNKGKFKAVVLKMTLPASCYATMALREVLRVDTSAAHQTSLNVT